MQVRGKKRTCAVACGVMSVIFGGYVARADHQPVDPVVEEPIRSLGIDEFDGLSGPDIAECGAMNAFVLPLGIILVSGLGWIPCGRPRRAAPRHTGSY